MAPGKRKRNDRASIDSGESRPSPHRPGNTVLGQHDREADMRNAGGGGGRRLSRGGRGGGRGSRIDRRESADNLSNMAIPPRGTAGPMSPPAPRPSSTRQIPPQPPATTPSPVPIEATPPPESTRDPVPYAYTHITDDRVASWSVSGRQEVVAAGVQAVDDLDLLDLSSIFQELIRAALDRRLDSNDAGECVKKILAASVEQASEAVDGSELFLDSLSIIADIEPFDQSLQRLILASGVSPNLMRQILDAPLLQNLGLARSTFIKAGRRQVTNLIYRQANHNLLREETEGYSKLVTELFTTSGSEPPSSEVVEDTFERVKGLIGTFDLDVGRVLDVTLDVFAAVLIKQFRFFVKFLRVSSWWPRETGLHSLSAADFLDGGLPKWALPGSAGWATLPEDEEANIKPRDDRDRLFWDRAREIGIDAYFELGGRRAVDFETKNRLFAEKTETDAFFDGDLQWIEATGTLPPSGNRVAAQLLGFKLRFYASEAREKEDVLPANLIYLAALLIKIGFISLRDLYSHLWPLDEDMVAVRESKMKELAEKERLNRPGAALNALMTAGALADDTLPNGGRTREPLPAKPDPAAVAPSTTEDREREALPEPVDQKVQLLTNLLTIGAIPESLFVLGRFPWLPEAFPDLYDLIHRIIHYSISKVYEDSRPPPSPLQDSAGLKFADLDQASAPKGQVRRNDNAQRKPMRWPFPDKSDVNEGQIYRFYWDEWADNVPVCQDINDVFTLCSTFLNLSGVNIGRDATLLSKLAVIGNKSLSEDQSEVNLARWQDLLKRLLVPALSLTRSNTNVANELYEMLQYYPSTVRFSIYAEWFEGQTSRIPAMMTAFSRARLETLSTMKRISMTNLTQMARTLAKTAYASPGVVFKVALDQIEAYSNLTEVVVECAKYFTTLGYDVLIWSLMSSLGGKNRSRTRDDSVLLTSRWLIALSKFSGKVFRRYSNMDPATILQYVNDQLYRGNSTDLIILEELIAQMSGVVSDLDFNDSQLLAMTGGEVLRRQTLINLQDKRFESTSTAKRLMHSLTGTKLAGQLLISIAQHRQSAIYAVPEEDAHIKYLAAMVDETQRILVQYLDLLRSNLLVNEFDNLVPGTPELMADFGLEPPLAFLVGRASYERRMEEHVEIKSIMNGVSVQMDEEGDVGMKSEDSLPSPQSEKASEPDAQMTGQGDELVSAALLPAPTDAWRAALQPLIDAVQTVLPENTWRLLHPEFYVVFWQLSLADVSMPMESYTAETQRLSNQISDLIKDRSNMSRDGMARKEETRKALETTRDELLKESKEEMRKYKNIRGRLNKEKMLWFINNQAKYDLVSDALLEECFLPRLLLSPSDADYCFKFLKFLHNNATPNFRTLGLYGRLFRANRLRSMIFACTVREAENLGRFLKHILGDLSRWHINKTVYEREALGSNRDLPGFAKQMGKDQKPAILLEHDDFRRLVFNFHKQLNTALKSCLTGTEWMHIRNAITILKSIVEYFPALDFMGKSYMSTLKTIAQRESKTREDLSLTANALMPELKRREQKWVMPQAFATNLGELGPQQNGARSRSIPQTESPVSKSSLKPTAPEFRPLSSNTSNGTSTPKQLAITEVEDGEVDDAKALNPMQLADTSHIAGQLASTTSSSSNLSASTKGGPQTVSGPRTTEQALTASVSSQYVESLRADTGRNSGPASVLDKLHPGLPSRPDLPLPHHHSVDRLLSSRSGDRREPHHSRLDRPNDGPRDRGRDSSNFDRRVPDVSSRDINRPGDRGLVAERERERDRHDFKRRGAEPIRDSRDLRDARDSRERLPMDNTRLSDLNGRLSRNDDMPPPRPIVEASQGLTVNAEPPINPARAAQIFSANEPPRTDSQRLSREEHRDRPPSRPHSPRRGDRYGGPERDSSDSRRNDSAPSRLPLQYTQEYPRGRHEEPQTRSSGIRNDRSGERGPPERLRDASSFQPTSNSVRPLDLEHGRLSRPQPDPNYGRLNDAPASQIPSGPRDRSNRGGAGGPRVGNAPQPRFEPRVVPQEQPRPPTPDKQPPTGPAATRAPRRTGSGLYDTPAAAPANTHTTPLAAPPTVGIHPERLKHIDPVAAQLVTSNSTSQIAQPTLSNVPSGDDGIHPSRMPSFHSDQSTQRQVPPAIQTSYIASSTVTIGSPGASGPPSGPRGQQSISSTSMSPGGINPPTGPSSNERTRGPNRHIAGINNTLQQAGQRIVPERASERITNIRGRGGRNSMGGPVFDLPPSPAPLTPTLPSSNRDAPGSGAGDRVRDSIVSDRPSDLFASRGMNGGGTDNERDRERADSRSGGGTRGRDPASRRDGGRSGRHSRRASRSRSQGRDGERERERERPRERGTGPLDEPQRGDYRDRGRGGDGRERRPNERDMGRRDDEKVQGRNGDGRDVLPPPRPTNEPDWGGSGLGASDRSGSGAGPGGGGGARRDMRSSNDGRRDSRGDGNGGSGRKRRGDEGGMSGMDNRGHDKRPRMMR